MAWQDKSLEAGYTSPSGIELTFQWIGALSRDTNLKTGTFIFPDRDGAHVQHQGAGARTFPFTCVFVGADCMDQADAFEATLIEQGVAELRHPVYGVVKVIPTGTIHREDDLFAALNQSTVGVTWTETITDESPVDLAVVTAADIEEKYDGFGEAASADFAGGLAVTNTEESITLESMLKTQAQSLEDNLTLLTEVDANSRANFMTTLSELKASIANLKGGDAAAFVNIGAGIKGVFERAELFAARALNVGRLALNLIKLPSRITTGIMEKVKGYSQLVTELINQFKNNPFETNNIRNDFASTGLVLTGCVASIASGVALSIAESTASGLQGTVGSSTSVGTFNQRSAATAMSTRSLGLTRQEALSAMSEIAALYDTVTAFMDVKISRDAFVDSNAESYLLFSELVYACLYMIQDVAFDLPMQRTIRIDRDRQIIELCCEVYGSPDYLEQFIVDNNFNLDEMEVIPMGREVMYYVQSA